jgi:hypothetical protein
MNTVAKVMTELKKKGNPLRIRAYAPHGAPENLFGVSVADMKVIAKKIKGRATQQAAEMWGYLACETNVGR